MTTAAHRLLHTLWTKAVGTPGYVKEEWHELERLLRLVPEIPPLDPQGVHQRTPRQGPGR